MPIIKDELISENPDNPAEPREGVPNETIRWKRRPLPRAREKCDEVGRQGWVSEVPPGTM